MRRGRLLQELGTLGWYVFGIVDGSNIGFVDTDTTRCCSFVTILVLPLLRDLTSRYAQDDVATGATTKTIHS